MKNISDKDTFEKREEKKLFIETYGCQMNVADSEVVASIMQMAGYTLCDTIEDSDAIFVNTCSIRDNAEQKVLSRLSYFQSLRKHKKSLVIGVLGCMAERVREQLITENGYFPVEDLKTLRHLGSYLQGHPDMKHIPGVDMSSGSLGQGISAAVGMALSAKLSGDDYRVYTLLGDGEIQEGQVWEAAMFAGFRKLDNLVVIVDNNGLQIDGPVDQVCSPYPIN